MDIEILYRPSYSLARIALEGGEEVRVEGGSMVSMSDGVRLETGATGGLWRSLGRSLFGGETFFQNTLRAPSRGGTVWVAPALPGDLLSMDLGGGRGTGAVRILRGFSHGHRARNQVEWGQDVLCLRRTDYAPGLRRGEDVALILRSHS